MVKKVNGAIGYKELAMALKSLNESRQQKKEKPLLLLCPDRLQQQGFQTKAATVRPPYFF
jgi:hypothetical protein